MTDDRTLYVGTDHALYRARPRDDGRWRAEGLALAGLGGVRGLVIDPDDPRRWWACTADTGVLVTRDAGVMWRECNRGIDRLAGWCLARDPRTGELWYGAEPASLYRSGDGGETWTACSGIDDPAEPPEWGERPPADERRVRHVALSPGGLVLAAVEEGWLVRSEDGGASWTRIRDGLDRDCHAATLLPGDPDTVLVSTGAGVHRSEDGGRTFEPSSDGLRHPYVTRVVVHPDRPEVAFTAASRCGPRASAGRPEGAGGACYRSDDGGRAWWRLTGGLPDLMRPAPTCVAGDPGDPDSFYVGTDDGSVWLTEDGGETFGIAVEGIQGWVRHLLLARR
ncbi:MAG: hypothetical protein E6J41_11255 [Chloroflexi bacterium]|nr:MAG: hypothetical protein E6J41_11255 [Chloroflexota bacterium]